MFVEAQVTINGSRAAVWAAITDIENAAQTISGIEKIEVLEKPTNGLAGLRWNRGASANWWCLFTEQHPVGWPRRPGRAAGSRSDKKLHHTQSTASGRIKGQIAK